MSTNNIGNAKLMPLIFTLVMGGMTMTEAPAKDYPWRVKVLDETTAGTGLIKGDGMLFTIANYWAYGHFAPREHCELPGKLFRAKASGEEGAQHVYYAPAFWGEINKYAMSDQTLYAAWRVKAPSERVAGGQFSLVRPEPGPWHIWCNRNQWGALLWYAQVKRDGQWAQVCIPAQVDEEGWMDMQVVMEPRAITLQFDGKDRGRFEHDAYTEEFIMTYGSGQTEAGGAEVISEYRETFFHSIPYPYSPDMVPDGPEDIRPEDEALCIMANPATPAAPRQGEGDLIERKDGSLLIAWSDHYSGAGFDGTPSRISGRISQDGGNTWGERWTIVRDVAAEQGGGPSPRHVSLVRARNGDLIMTSAQLLPGMKREGMVVRRSTDDGQSWSEPKLITPNNDNRHLSNNACLRMLSTGRIILSCREYVGGIRWPYCMYSDDDGYTWQAGQHVPDPELTPAQKRGQNVNEPSVAELADGRLLATMRSVAGGQFFSYSSDGGETWTKPYLSPLVGTCSPATIRRIPGTDDVLAVFTYGYSGRTPLTSAISSDGGKTWRHLKLVEQSQYHGYCYTSITFIDERVYLTYMHYPNFTSLERFEMDFYCDQRLTVLPIEWFYRDVPPGG